jgi:acetoin utilization protein AcuC
LEAVYGLPPAVRRLRVDDGGLTPATDAPVLVVHHDDLGLDFGPDHPNDRRRHRLAVALCRDAGLLNGRDAVLEGPAAAMSDEELCLTLAPAYVRAIKRYSAQPGLAKVELEAAQWGIDGDNGAFAGMHEASAWIAGASAQAARGIAEGRVRRAFAPAGGIHHASANRAHGFGLYNDGAIAINTLLRGGIDRVAYVDLDVHHGNGTQAIFYTNPNVLTVSVHESGRHLFPGSGFPNEIGGPGAEGTSANVALPPFAGDAAYRTAFDGLVAPLLAAFRPDVIVAQCGVDSHHADPLSHLLTTLPLFPWLWRRLREEADRHCGGRWLALAGGGYEPCSVPPRAWALLLAEQAGCEMEGDLPESWREHAMSVGCPSPAQGWLDDPGPAPDAERDARAQRESEQAVATTRQALSPYWAL